jgi:flagellar hook-basal body complex protein FliE
MSTEFLPPIAPLPALAPADGPISAFRPIGPSSTAMPGNGAASVFGTAVTQGLQRVDGSLQASQADLQRLAAGDVSSLHQVMVRLEESRLSMQLVLQVRNRLLESYQELMRMQV